ncbi:hypothetical protein ACFQ61_08030 [Streptomyces sp. NPDC056500]|uniref:hypothetical protein n=1 Tax=Streptomyces sp. NPDC056500 TaxID=3345840 RepID=UPI0036A98ECB
MAPDYRMKYHDLHHQLHTIRERSIDRMKYVAEHAPCGRYEIQKATGDMWDAHEVRKLEVRGLWDVEWLEPGDENHEGGWRILRLNEVGRNVIRKWQDRGQK